MSVAKVIQQVLQVFFWSGTLVLALFIGNNEDHQSYLEKRKNTFFNCLK